MSSEQYPLLIFECPYDERLAFEAEARGHLGGVTVELADGSRHRVFYYDPVRLQQDLNTEADLGRPFIAEKGMIVLKAITLENMQNAVDQLAKEGYFQRD